MILSTHSGVGKNLILSGIARYLSSRKKISVAPFKGCNIEPYSCVLRDGKRMAWAQAIQCKAAAVEPSPVHSPIVALFPGMTRNPGDHQMSELLILGEPTQIDVDQNYWFSNYEMYRSVIADSIASLRSGHDLLIIEGAGSPTELGLEAVDLPNHVVHEYTDASIVLVTEQMYGGGYAHLVGTLQLMPRSMRRHVKGIILNKFPVAKREEWKEAGVRKLEEITGVPVIGEIPWLQETHIPSENIFADESVQSLDMLTDEFDALVDALMQYIDLSKVYDICTGKEGGNGR